MENQNEEYATILPRRISNEDLAKLHAHYKKNLSQEAVEYLKRRGITLETAERFELGYESFQIGFQTPRGKMGGYFTNCIVFPVRDADGSIVDLIGRSIFDEKPKYKALVGKGEVFFNEEIIENSDDILLCKNVFDVLSLEQAQMPAICSSDFSSFKESHAHKLKGKRIFICYPNDETGRRESNRISSLLHELAKEIYNVYLPEGFRDINNFFVQVKNPAETFQRLLNETVEETLKVPVSPDVRNLVVFVEEYMKRHSGDVQGTPTGFPDLDEKLVGGLRTGFYLITGMVSSGKSMLLRQLADHISFTGVPVVYVSWDMTAFELWARSIARILQVSPQQVITAQVPIEGINQANQEYSAMAKHMWTLEGTMDTSLDEVEDYIERIIQSIGRVPIVFIDHLLRIPLRDKEGRLIQQNYSLVSYILHQWSRQWDTSIVAVAPQQIHEHPMSGAVEAAVDVILTMQKEEHEQDEKEKEKMGLYLKKNRNGTLGKISLVFDKEKAIFLPSHSLC